MSISPDILTYYGTTPPHASCWRRAFRWMTSAGILAIFAIIMIARFALLASGYICIFTGTLLLMLGGRRSAGVKLARWRAKAAELMKLWLADILRPFRRRASGPIPVLPI